MSKMGSCASTTAAAPEAGSDKPVAVEAKDEKLPRNSAVPDKYQAIIFDDAHTHHGFFDKPVTDEQLKTIYEHFKWGPTAFNSTPLRVFFIKTKESKEKLLPALMGGNVEQTKQAPVTAILAYSTDFVDKFAVTSPYYDAAAIFKANPGFTEPTARLNASIQIGYFIVACRAHGLDCGPMTGFDTGKVDEAFFKGTPYHVLALCNVGYGDVSKLYPRAPRLDFNDATKII